MTVVDFRSAPVRVTTPEDFMVLWQDAETRHYLRVGSLRRHDGEYEFRYMTALPENFRGFASFPDLDQEYRSPRLFPLFANRVMTPRREGYGPYLDSLGLTGDSSSPADPFEVLARTWGSRQTDRVVVIPIPRPATDGLLTCIIPVHGSRHVDPLAERLRRLRPGAPLTLEREPDNPVSQRAILIEPAGGHGRDEAIGYIPEEFTPLVEELWAQDAPMRVLVEHFNPPGPDQVADRARILVRLDAICEPGSDPGASVGR